MAQLLVQDIMVSDVVTLTPEDSVERAVSVLLEHNVGGVPVVDGERRVVGLLSDGDLVAREGHIHVPNVYSLFGEAPGGFPWEAWLRFEHELRRVLGSTVAEVMEVDPPTCSEAETVEDVATRLLDLGARRLPVVREGRLVGIVARGDLLRLLAPRREAASG